MRKASLLIAIGLALASAGSYAQAYPSKPVRLVVSVQPGGNLDLVGRTALLPDVPAIGETVPGFQASIFNGMMAPAGTPPEIPARMHGEIVRFVQSPEIRARFAGQGVELQASASPEAFTAYIRTEYERWAKVMEEAGIKPE